MQFHIETSVNGFVCRTTLEGKIMRTVASIDGKQIMTAEDEISDEQLEDMQTGQPTDIDGWIEVAKGLHEEFSNA